MDDSLASDLRRECGDALRAIGTYDGDGYHVHYLREDVESGLDAADLDDIRQGAVLDTLHRDYYERLFSTAGTFEATVRLFERALILEVPTGAGAGVMVSLDRDHDGSARAIVERCRDALG